MAKYRDSDYAAWAQAQFDWDLDPQLVRIDVRSMRSPEDVRFAAQRPLDGERAAGIAEHFLPAVAAGGIVVALPDGRRVWVDGQHRWKAAKDANQPYLWALLFRMEERQAAAFFRLRNGPAISMSNHMDSTLAARESAFPRVQHITEILDRYGCYLDRAKRHKDGAIASSRTVETIYKVDDGALLLKTIDLISECWGISREAMSAEMLEGVALFLAHWGPRFDSVRTREMYARFKAQELLDILRDALGGYAKYRSANKATWIEAQLLFIFNRNRRDINGFRLPERAPAQLKRLGNLTKMIATRATGGTGTGTGTTITTTEAAHATGDRHHEPPASRANDQQDVVTRS